MALVKSNWFKSKEFKEYYEWKHKDFSINGLFCILFKDREGWNLQSNSGNRVLDVRNERDALIRASMFRNLF